MTTNEVPMQAKLGELLSSEERAFLLRLARQAIELTLNRQPVPKPDREDLSGILAQPGASFVTLTINGELRGCVGALEPYQPLVDDVREHAIAAAFQDFRFPPVTNLELPHIKIEISRLTIPLDLDYETVEELIRAIRPAIDGVTLFDGPRRATFLPQVWEKLPRTDEFLEHLCVKMGASPDLWKRRKMRVQTYQVEEFHE